MTCGSLLLFLCVVQISMSDWVSEWMGPVQDQFDDGPDKSRRTSNDPKTSFRLYEDEAEKVFPLMSESTEKPGPFFFQYNNDISTNSMKLKLQTTLANAQSLAEILKAQILELTSQESILKEAITNGRSGVTHVLVSTIGQLPRSYIIREGVWTLCTGVVQPPVAEANLFKRLFTTPRCYGQEVATRADPCVFNSVIKYETIPTRRRIQYIEDDYLCLKPNFNNTLEQYLSVPKRVINETCTNGIMRSLEDNILECSMRVLSEYTYYPNRGFGAHKSLPLEYCTENDGACKLIVAWHVSNSTIENFEFLKNEPNFKKYFISPDSYLERII